MCGYDSWYILTYGWPRPKAGLLPLSGLAWFNRSCSVEPHRLFHAFSYVDVYHLWWKSASGGSKGSGSDRVKSRSGWGGGNLPRYDDCCWIVCSLLQFANGGPKKDVGAWRARDHGRKGEASSEEGRGMREGDYLERIREDKRRNGRIRRGRGGKVRPPLLEPSSQPATSWPAISDWVEGWAQYWRHGQSLTAECQHCSIHPTRPKGSTLTAGGLRLRVHGGIHPPRSAATTHARQKKVRSIAPKAFGMWQDHAPSVIHWSPRYGPSCTVLHWTGPDWPGKRLGRHPRKWRCWTVRVQRTAQAVSQLPPDWLLPGWGVTKRPDVAFFGSAPARVVVGLRVSLAVSVAGAGSGSVGVGVSLSVVLCSALLCSALLCSALLCSALLSLPGGRCQNAALPRQGPSHARPARSPSLLPQPNGAFPLCLALALIPPANASDARRTHFRFPRHQTNI